MIDDVKGPVQAPDVESHTWKYLLFPTSALTPLQQYTGDLVQEKNKTEGPSNERHQCI